MTGRVIVITSGKGGVGKTTTSANIGTALAKAGNKVVLIDTDIGLRNLDLLLGLENRIVYTIVDVVEERCKLKQALVKDKKNPNLALLAAAQTRDKTSVSQEQLKDICEKFGQYIFEMEFPNYYMSAPYEYYLHHSKPNDRLIFKGIIFEQNIGENVEITEYWENLIYEYNRWFNRILF